MTWIEAGAGWPVILVHGFPLDAEIWRPQLAAVPQGWRYIAPDLRGFGAGPPADGAASMDGYAADLEAFMDALALESAVIGGLSMGGYATFALQRRAAARITALILADTRAQADTPAGRDARAQMRAMLAEKGTAGVAAQMLPKLFSADASTEAIDAVRQMIESQRAEGVHAAIGAMMDRPDSTRDLDRIACATLVVVGEADAITPVADSEAMQRAIPRSTLTVIPGAGHLANVEQPEAFSRALEDFLRSAL